jgi:hypothetical protein
MTLVAIAEARRDHADDLVFALIQALVMKDESDDLSPAWCG